MKPSGNQFVTGLVCSVCCSTYTETEVTYTCPTCGANLGFTYDSAGLGQHVREHGLPDRNDMYRYQMFMPLSAASVSLAPSLPVGGTPLFPAPRLSNRLGVNLWIKDDGKNPTGSLKDRASSFIVTRALADDIPMVCTASTGNAGAALAGNAAAAGIPTVIMVPKSAPVAKIAQLQIYGANVILVDGTYDDAFALARDVCQQEGWYNRSTGLNPLTAEGKKTVGLEICEQWAGKGHLRGTFAAPDWVAVSVGDGNIVTGLCRGLMLLHQAGLIDRVPRVLAVNSEKSPACSQAFESGLDAAGIQNMSPVSCNTRADSIAADLPADRVHAVKLVRETEGTYVRVSDEAILEAIRTVARFSGCFLEPAAACAYAGIEKAVSDGIIAKGESVVLLATGTGLKDPLAATSAPPPVVKPGDIAGVLNVASMK